MPPVIGTNWTGATARRSHDPSEMFFDQPKLLIIDADGNHQSAASGKLFDKRFRHGTRRGGHQDNIERRLFGPALVAIAAANMDICRSQEPPVELAACSANGRRISMPKTSLHNSAKMRRLIAGSDPDLQRTAIPSSAGRVGSSRPRCRAARWFGPVRSAAGDRRRPDP